MNAALLLRALGAGFVILLWQPLAWADFKATQEEANMCAVTIWSRMVQGDKNWSHVHHYCDCVRFTNRALSVMWKDKQAFTYNLGEAMGGCDYVISHTTADFSLLPEIYLQKAVIYSMRKENALAAAHYIKAMDSNPKLVKAYIGLAEYFAKNNDKKKALEIITRGLRHNSDSKALKRRYTELGGKLPYPAPTTPIDAPDKPVEVAVAPKPSVIAVPSEPTTAATDVGVATPTTTEAPPGIGSPTNPWCRFCPDTAAAQPVPTPAMPGAIPRAAP